MDRAPVGEPDPTCMSWSKALSHSGPQYSHQCPKGLNLVSGPFSAVTDKPSGSKSHVALVGSESTKY